MHPASMSLHYGQAIFEGMKATLSHKTGKPLLFRPEQNAKRMNLSAHRMGIPAFPEELFVEALKTFVQLEKKWIPSDEGSALYLRPFIFANEAFISIRASNEYRFMIIATPAGPFFQKRIKLLAETNYIRAAIGGTGEAKAAGNYAAAVLPTETAKQNGYDQVLWLDANTQSQIQEVGTMNIFFKVQGKIITPKPDGCILKGITRDSVITLLRDKGYTVEERAITIQEVLKYHEEGVLEEAFGTGTAVSIAKVELIAYKEKTIPFPQNNPLADDVLSTIDGIKTEQKEDKFNWIVQA
jgi:branched-chain amino acid aminotransferase